MHILFVTRKFPPSKGGMENAAFELYTALASRPATRVKLVKWGGGNKWLPCVYPILFLRALWYALVNRPDVIYLQDGVMAPLGSMLKVFVRQPTVITIHGKEAAYANPLYQMIVPPAVKRQDLLVTVSEDTRQMVQRAFPGTNPIVICNGVADKFYNPASRNLERLAKITGLELHRLQQARILHTHGRLVRRKGVLWFVENLMPRLVAADSSILYLISGEGTDRAAIEGVIASSKLENHVKLLGLVSDEVRELLYNTANIFLMPNIPVAQDMEGFGLVALEAASCGSLVVASNLEGIPDAIKDGKNGVLVKAGDAEAYLAIIQREFKNRTVSAAAARAYTLKHFSWVRIAGHYDVAMRSVLS